MKKYAVIVAGGSGTRMGADIPKQFIEVGGKPVLMHTIEAFKRYDSSLQIVLVLPESQFEYWQELCTKFEFKISHEIAKGGVSRFHSVQNGLSCIKEEALIAIHDGVRPFVSKQTLDNCFLMAIEKGNAIPVLDAYESVRLVDGVGSIAYDRDRVKLVQTPQVFDSKVLMIAYNQKFSPLFTDDASVVEANGGIINLVEGNRENIKLTTPMDLILAEAFLSKGILKE